MKLKKLVSLLLSAAVALSVPLAVPAVQAEDNYTWNYGFEGSDIGGAISGYNEAKIVTDPSNAQNMVYNLGTDAIAKYSELSGKNKISFDFEYKQVYDSTTKTGDCTFSAIIYRNGADYKSADRLSTTSSGALQFNSVNVTQPDSRLYYLKNGKYNVEWIIDTESKHQTVTLTGLINGVNDTTITVVDADFTTLNSVEYEYTSGIQIKGGDLYLDNLILQSVAAEPTATPTAAPTSAPTASPSPTPAAENIWSYDFEGTTSNLTGYNAANVAQDPTDSSNKVLSLNTSQKQISKLGQKFYGNFIVSYDFISAGLTSDFYVDLIRNNGNYNYRDRLIFDDGLAKFNGAATINPCYIQANKKYHVDWTVDGVKNEYTISITGSVSANNTNFADDTIVLGTYAIPDKTNGNIDSPYVYTSGMYVVNTTPANGIAYVDNIAVSAIPSDFDIEEAYEIGTTQINVSTNQFYVTEGIDSKLSMTKDGAAFDGYTVAWTERDTYSTSPVITFTSPLEDGAYEINVTDLSNSFGKNLNTTKAFTVAVGDPFNGFAEAPQLTVDKTEKTISGFINGYPAQSLVPVWKTDGNTAEVKDIYGNTAAYVYDGYTYEITDNKNDKFTYTFAAKDDIYSNDFNSAVALTDGTNEITSTNRGQRDKMFPAADAEYTETDAKPMASNGTPVTNWTQSLFQNIVINDAGLALNREAAPMKSDRAIAIKSYEYTENNNVQVIKDFYTAPENYPVQISMSIMPDGKGDVATGLKTSYYNESIQSNPNALDGSGMNYTSAPISFGADGQILSFGNIAGTYEPGNWYNISIVLDRTEVDNHVTKTAKLYLNGVKLGDDYDWSGIASTLGNDGFYSLTMRENYVVSGGEPITSTSYFDNLSITELYNANVKPNGYMFDVTSSSTDYKVVSKQGKLMTDKTVSSAELLNKLSTPGGDTTVSVINASGEASDTYALDGTYKVVYKNGDYVQSYSIVPLTAVSTEPVITLYDASGEASQYVSVGTNKITVSNVQQSGECIAAVYNSSNELVNINKTQLVNGAAEVSFTIAAGQKIKFMIWDSMETLYPVINAIGYSIQ